MCYDPSIVTSDGYHYLWGAPIFDDNSDSGFHWGTTGEFVIKVPSAIALIKL